LQRSYKRYRPFSLIAILITNPHIGVPPDPLSFLFRLFFFVDAAMAGARTEVSVVIEFSIERRIPPSFEETTAATGYDD